MSKGVSKLHRYIIRRLLFSVPSLLIVSLLVFSIVRILPGDVVMQLIAEAGDVSPERLSEVRRELGLDEPFFYQYITWLGNVLKFDFGTSLWTGNPVRDEIGRRMPVSMQVSLLATFFGALIAIPIGVMSAIRQDKPIDYIGRLISIGGLSVPDFWLATIVIVLPAMWWRVTPPLGYAHFIDDPIKNLQQTWLPATVLGLRLSASVMRITRSQMLEVLRQDYIRTAWSKGLAERSVIYRHAMKNALIPVVTVLGTQVSRLMGGTLIIEVMFSLPGVGRFLYEAINHRDYPSIQAGVMFLATVMVIMNLIVDLMYGWFDPRIRYN